MFSFAIMFVILTRQFSEILTSILSNNFGRLTNIFIKIDVKHKTHHSRRTHMIVLCCAKPDEWE